MRKTALAVVLALSASSAFAGASNFTLINGTDGALGTLSIRRAGTDEWKPLGTAPSAGARSPISFNDPDCAFDIRASSANGPVTWAGVNLCDVRSVILRRDAAVGAWVDYDQ